MLSAAPIRGDGTYYQQLAQTDYYTKGGEPPGRWVGTGAERMGLIGKPITDDSLKNLLNGCAPDGSRNLVFNAGKENRQKGYDFTFSAPKDVSVLWAASPEWMRLEIQRAQQAAVERAILYLEDNALFTRRGKGGVITEKAKAIVATYEHCTSRAEEPQLHTHCLFANVCLREDGTTGTFYGRVIKDKDGNAIGGVNPLLDHKLAAGSVFQVALASELRRGLGLQIVPAENGFSFEIVGVNKEAGRFFSSRRQQIDDYMKERGFETAEQAEIANFETRPEKREVSRPKLIDRWADDLVAYGMTPHQAELLCNQAERYNVDSVRFEEAIRSAEEELVSNQSCFSKSDLVEKTANKLVASGASIDDIEKAIDLEISEGEIVSLGHERLQRVLSSQASLEMEDKFSRQIQKAGRNFSFKTSNANIAAAIRKTEYEMEIEFDEDYRRAISYLVTGITPKGKDVGANRVLVGDAGSGKTTLLGTVRTALELEGYRVVGAALAGRAADVLEQKAGIKSATIDKWNFELDRSNMKKSIHTLDMLMRAAKNKHTWSLDHFKLDNKTALVIDEAVMTDTAKLFRLYERAQKAGAMVIWSGDIKQCQAIGHGGAFSLASRVSDSVRISKNFRQKSFIDRQVAKLMAEGKSERVLQNLVWRDLLHVQPTKRKAIDRLVDDWAKQGVQAPQDNQIFASRHEDRKTLNELCQQRRIQSHKRKLRVGLTNHEGQTIYKGDRINFGENMILHDQHQSFGEYLGDKAKEVFSGDPGGQQRVRRGQFGTVLSVNPIAKTIRVKTDDGRLLNVPMEIRDESQKTIFGNYRKGLFGAEKKRKAKVSLGYATTTHAGQGSEFENTYILAGGRMQDRELSYVQLSRHMYKVNLYTTENEAGQELLLRSLLNEAAKQNNQDRVEALRKQIKEIQEKQEGTIGDGLLAIRMAKSNRKEFALEPASPDHEAQNIAR